MINCLWILSHLNRPMIRQIPKIRMLHHQTIIHNQLIALILKHSHRQPILQSQMPSQILKNKNSLQLMHKPKTQQHSQNKPLLKLLNNSQFKILLWRLIANQILLNLSRLIAHLLTMLNSHPMT